MKVLTVVADARENFAGWRRFLEPKLKPFCPTPEFAAAPEIALGICRRENKTLDCVLIAVGANVPVNFIVEIVRLKIPIAVVSYADSALCAVAALKAGASDFLLRQNLTADNLREALQQAVGNAAASPSSSPSSAAAPQIENHRVSPQTLRVSEEGLQLALDAGRLGTWETDPNTKEIFWDARTRELFGVAPDEQISYDEVVWKIVLPEDREAILKEVGKALAPEGAGVYEMQHRVRLKDGSIRWLHNRGQVSFEGDGKNRRPVLMRGTVADITERKRAEEAHHASEARYQILFDSIDEGFCTCEVFFDAAGKAVDYRMLEVNPSFEKLTGISAKEALSGKTIREVVPGLEEHWFEIYGRVAWTGESVRFEQGSDALGSWFDVYAFRIGEPKERKVAILFNNISERKKFERERERFFAVSSSLQVITGTDGFFKWVSPTFERLLGWTQEEMISQPWTSFVHPDDVPKSEAETDNLFKGNETFAFENRYRHKDGSYRWFLWNAQQFAGENIIYGAAIDITARKAAEEALREAEERFRLLTENAEDYAIIFLDTEARITAWNVGAERILGWTETEAVGQFGHIIFTPEDRAGKVPEKELSTAADAGHARNERYHLRKDGSRFFAFGEMIALYDEAGSLRGFAKLFRDLTERKKQDDALSESEARFRAIVDQATAGITQNDFAGRFTFVNDRYCEIVGYSREELLQMRMQDISDPHVLPANVELYNRALQDGTPFVIEKQYISKDGARIWVNNSVAPVLGANGRPESIVCVSLDITERKRAEEALRESEERFRNMADHAPVMVWVTEPDGTCTYLSQSWYNFTGQTPETGLGFGWLSATHPDDFERSEKIFLDANERRAPFSIDYRLRRADGSYAWAVDSAQPRFANDGEFLGYIGSVIDITERKRAEDAVRESESNLRTLADSIPQLAWMAEPDGFIFWYNRRWYEYTGTTFEQMQGWGWETVHDPEMLPKVVERWRHSIETGEPFEMEFPLKGADNVFRWFLTRVYPLRDSTGKITRWFGTNTDVDESRRLRREAEEANLAKDEFLAVLSHELRTPLNAMYGWAQILETSNFDREKTRQAIEIISRNVRLQNALIEDLLDVSRIISGKMRLEPETVSLVSIVQSATDAARPAAEKQGVRLEFGFDPNADEMFGDRHRLQQIVGNLLTNAVKFTPAGGSIKVELKRAGKRAKLIIADTGIGVAPELLPQIFDRFRQADASSKRKFGGLGLGLTIVKHLVELHGGTISVRSKGEGRGTTFTVELPLAAPKITHADLKLVNEGSGNGSKPTKPLAGMKILAVDDDPDALDLMCFVLENQGADVVCCNTAREALETLQNDRFNLLISDLGMAEMDGFDLIREVRARENGNGAPLPAIALTGYVSADDRERVLAAGFQTHLPKPVNLENLSATTLDLIEK